MSLWSLWGLAIALSLDGFSAGVAYGAKRIRVPLSALLIICFCSSGAMLIALLLGRSLADWLQTDWLTKVGGILLVTLGIFQIYQAIKAGDNAAKVKEITKPVMDGGEGPVQPVWAISLPPFGLVIQVLREPTSADLDASGEIGPWEAFLLGLALNIDATAAGFGMALATNHGWLLPLAVGVMQLLFVTTGLGIGRSYARRWNPLWMTYLAAAILCSLGLSKIVT
ncbi:sporulation membrane protein YtaF [Heliophilum fasciatum]|uniref:Putative sporulation protein YtaF n=1 Tax=Heliophilum fasciatum TaxID=35700 RepID=A0A4R2RZ32_9FIRM|nr:sporulation membrane protein YtaF [Heliophilum fasciatum]MCW2276726.1 putative sporulation protein YtaF [Heliophilum fasciatum]TCP68893.1 putative sporulation protein YtaF [Heliophilum fasciatum]